MPQPKRHTDAAARQRAYRARRRARETAILQEADRLAEMALLPPAPAELEPELARQFVADADPEPTESAGKGYLTETEYMNQVRAMVARGGSLAIDFSDRR